jgi:exosortase H (IPTLxxWG-CTERM-specific)
VVRIPWAPKVNDVERIAVAGRGGLAAGCGTPARDTKFLVPFAADRLIIRTPNRLPGCVRLLAPVCARLLFFFSRSRWFMARFFLTFLALQLSLFGINMLGVVQQHVVLPWTMLLARMCAGLVTWFDSSAAAAGKVLWNTVTGFGVSIEPGCNGIEACIVLFAAVVAFPSSWRHKLIGLAAGFVAVQGLNMVRVISLFYLGQWDTQVFNFAHEYLWQALIMLDVLIVWLLWVRAGNKAAAAPAEAAAV